VPELPEVETVCRLLRRVLVGNRLSDVEVASDDIVFKGQPSEAIRAGLEGRTVTSVGRKGKFWWLTFSDGPAFIGHLGMTGWIFEPGVENAKLLEHGNAPRLDAEGRPRFLKVWWRVESGRSVAFVDGRRLARAWFAADPLAEKSLAQMGPDVWSEPRSPEELAKILGKRTAPMKALLLDQKLFCGIGNYLADEVLFQARIAPTREGSSLSAKDIERMLDAIRLVIGHAIDVEADYQRFPADWLFHARWGGHKGEEQIVGHAIRREEIGGRTTAWVPTLQK
jgi:formamidopyrimidine-DNA glycosylase